MTRSTRLRTLAATVLASFAVACAAPAGDDASNSTTTWFEPMTATSAAVVPGAESAAPVESSSVLLERTITLEEIEEMFATVEATTDWDMAEPKLWGHYFGHPERKRLELAATALAVQGFDFVDIYPPDVDAAPEDALYYLHVERAEVHDPQSLLELAEGMYQLAERFALTSYDGMDVGPVE
jgi:hypothetical protein